MAKATAAAITLALALLAPAHAVVPELGQPAWTALTPHQKEVLAPLVPEWDRLDDARKRKWLGIAARYPQMALDEQQRVQARMRQWASLTPEERRAAREQFRKLQSLHPEAREALKRKWQEYENLPDEEKKRLTESAAKRPVPKTAVGTPGLTAPSLQFQPALKAVPQPAGQPSGPGSAIAVTPSDDTPKSGSADQPGSAPTTASSSAPQHTQ